MEELQDNSHVYDFLYRIERRIGYLEKDSAFIEKKISTLDESKDRQFKILLEELNKSHLEIESITKHFNECIHAMTRMSKNLKNTVKKEEIETLSNQIDEIKFEEYIMPSDIKREI
jgi:type I site-specific restriction endonuclease